MSWKRALEQNRRDVRSLTRPEMTSVTDVLVEAHERTAKALAKFIKEHKGTDYQLHKHRALIAQLEGTLEIVRDDLPKATLDDLNRGKKTAARAGISNTESIARAGERRFRGETHTVRIPIAKVLTRVDRTLIGRYETKSSRYAGQVGNRIRRELAVGVVRGETVDQIARRLLGEKKAERLADSPTKTADAIADRDFFRSKSDAERLVRTEMSNAYTEAQLESLDELESDDPGWKKRWDAANDRLVCDDCAELDGVVVDLNENFPGGLQGPPLHPNDRCCVVPHRDGWHV